MIQPNIIFSGPTGTGVTTAIQAISDVPWSKAAKNENPDIHGTDSAENFLIYGLMELPGGDKIQLYGGRGQQSFDYFSNELTAGSVGLILLVDNTRSHPFKDMKLFLDAFEKFIISTQVAIGVTHTDLCGKPTIADYHIQLQGTGLKPPIFAVDARQKKDVSLLVQSLLYSLDPGLSE